MILIIVVCVATFSVGNNEAKTMLINETITIDNNTSPSVLKALGLEGSVVFVDDPVSYDISKVYCSPYVDICDDAAPYLEDDRFSSTIAEDDSNFEDSSFYDVNSFSSDSSISDSVKLEDEDIGIKDDDYYIEPNTTVIEDVYADKTITRTLSVDIAYETNGRGIEKLNKLDFYKNEIGNNIRVKADIRDGTVAGREIAAGASYTLNMYIYARLMGQLIVRGTLNINSKGSACGLVRDGFKGAMIVVYDGGKLNINGYATTSGVVGSNANDYLIVDGGDAGSASSDPIDATNAAIVLDGGTATLSVAQIRRNDNRSTNGGGIRMYGASKLTLTNSKIDQCYCNQGTSDKFGGGLYATDTAVVNVNGSVNGFISRNKATYGGGVLLNGSATMTINNAKFTVGSTTGTSYANSATYGGGIYVRNNATLTITNIAGISNNNATDGGAVYIGGGTFNMAGGTLGSNTASNHGAGVYCGASGKINITGGTISNNTATIRGGGMYITGAPQSNISITNCTFDSNIATQDRGGGIFMTTSGAVINGVTFSGNKSAEASAYNANGHGGAIYANGNAGDSVDIDDCTFNNNISGKLGGGVYLTGSQSATIDNCKFTGNKALTLDGGAICLYGNAQATVTASQFGSNTAKEYGGATACYTDNTKITLNNCIIGAVDNVAKANTANNGGGVGNRTGSSTVSGGQIVNNSAVNGGGACVAAGNLSISGCTISNNIATSGVGGGVYVNGSAANAEIKGDTSISNNSATSGGGVYLGSSSVGKIDDVTFTLNNANGTGSSGNGGGIAVSSSKLELLDSTFSKNNANKSGGAVMLYLATSGSYISNCTIGSENNANTATLDGGGVYTTLTKGFDITGGSISFNTASGRGGGIALRNQSTLTIDGTVISKNTAASDGGGIFVGCDADCTSNCGNGSSLTINHGEISDNTGGNGGGIYFRNGSIGVLGSSDMTKSTVISNNTSNNSGGGVDTCFYNQLTLNENLTISKNKAKGAPNASLHGGGGLMVRDGSSATINGSVFSENAAENGYGGGICIGCDQGSASSESVTINADTVIFGNTALLDGGGVYMRGTGNTLSATGSAISSNTSNKGNGGGLAIYEIGSKDANDVVTINTVTLTGVIMRSNKALFDTPDATPKMNTDGSIYTDSAGNEVYTFVATSLTGNGGAIFAKGIGTKIEVLPLVQNGITTQSVIGEFEGDGLYSNQAVHGGGFAIMDGAALVVTNTVVKYNKAVRNGGGFFVLGCGEGNDNIYPTTVNLTNGLVAGNFAESALGYSGELSNQAEIDRQLKGQLAEVGGGAVYIRGKSNYSSKTDPTINKAVKLTVNGTTFNGNHSVRGGAFNVHECSTLSVNNSSIKANYASSLGGALFFVKTTEAVANFEDCTFEENYAALRGGAMFIYTDGVSVNKCTFKGNYTTSATAGYGGAIMIKNTSGVEFDFVVTDSTFEGNRSCYGGAISTLEAYANATLINAKLDNCTFKNNIATYNGGAIIVGSNIALVMNGGYVFENTAGDFSAATLTVAEGTNYENASATEIGGAGGGIAVFGGTYTMTVNDTVKGAIYGNLASIAGDDVFSNGADTAKLSIPDVIYMDLSSSGFDPDVRWHEDYANGEVSGLTPSIASSVRYRQSNNTIVAPLSAINTQGNYIAITLGVSVNMGTLTITKTGTGIDEDQVFIFKVIGTATRTGATIELTVSIKGTGSVTINNLPVGEYSVYELSDWSWRYGVTSVIVNGETYADHIEGKAVVATSVESIDGVVIFDNEVVNNRWLDGNSNPVKNVAGTTSQNGREAVYEFILPKRNLYV